MLKIISISILISLLLINIDLYYANNTEIIQQEEITQKIPASAKIEIKNASTTQKITTKKKPVVTISTSTPAIVEPKKIIEEPQIPFEIINVKTREALVNILCSAEQNSPVSPISGSGIIIGDKGVILTNAHIGQYFLLKKFVKCVIRTGNPAYPTYNAELIYISPSWVSQNKTMLIDQNPKGTGEYDFAFLRITDRIDGISMPEKIPSVDINLKENYDVGSYALLASYPAGFLGGQSILQNLFQTSAITSIKDIYTFKENTLDLISIPGTVVSQKGSSGGAVVDGWGLLIGVISTSSDGDQTSQRDLRAITPSYINRALLAESGKNINDILSYPKEYAQNFNTNIAPKLSEIIETAISK